ncbi:MAG: YtxH domain-containing protein [Bacteroidales bacterium]|nr:YtxH domain-containing protein [Bacteroidales bacterium]MBN2749897.1 YtxH domain-containing protein [Bacteroidales bacterium]
MNSKSALLGVLAGITAGALLGVLFAPAKGSKTRKAISRSGEDFVDGLKDKLTDLIESMTEKFEEAKETATDFAEQHGKSKSKEA